MSQLSIRLPHVPDGFIRLTDPTNGMPLDVYAGPTSPNGIMQAFLTDLGPAGVRFEYRLSADFPDLSAADAAEVAQEILDFVAQHPQPRAVQKAAA